MTNRIFPPHTPQPSPKFGLVGWLEQTRVQLPLKGVECQFHVCGDILSVEIDQIFHQSAAQAMECLYSFPLPAGAAVYRCEMHVNGRVIRARVEEQERAREIAREQKAAGRRTALVEMERENLFTLSLGNLQPGDVVVIRFGYFETLTRLADWTSLRIPFCPGVRYIPGQPLLRALRGKGVMDDTDQVPDASRISPPRIDALHPDAAYLSVEGVMENPVGTVSEISSPSHLVLVKDGDAQCSVTLAQQGAMPDCDFALRWTETRGEQMQSAAWALREGAETYALVILQAPRVTMPVETSPQDFYFLVDRSGSMQGLKWEKAVQSFRSFLNQLGPEDRAWATFFSDRWQDFAEKPLTARELAVDASLRSLEKLGADGGTELLPALLHTLEVIQRHSTGREAALILITDGEVGNEGSILASLHAHPNLRVHAFGIDTAVNDALLVRLAAEHRGSSCLLQPTDDIVGAVTRLSLRLRRPVLTSIVANDGWELPGTAVSDLHSEECLSLSLKINSAAASEVVVKGRLPDGGEQTFRFPLVERTEPAIRLLWARSRIRHLLNQGARAEAIALAKQHNLLCEGAAFIAWDEAEQVAIAERELFQPSFDKKFATSSRTAVRVCLKDAETTFYRMAPRPSPPQLPSPPSAAEKVTAMLTHRPQLDGAQFQKKFGRRLEEWYLRFMESFAFSRLASDGVLAELLIEWLVDGALDAKRRMKCLEQLMNTLEAKASTPETGLALTLQWVTQSMSPADAYRERTQAALQGVAQRLADIRQREREQGTKILMM